MPRSSAMAPAMPPATLRRGLVLGLAAGAIALLAACSGGMMMHKPEPTLYERLGGKPAITAVVDQFVANVAADGRINRFFAHADIAGLKMKLVDQICQASGGPCVYGGLDMRTAHHGMGITDADFNALVGDLVAALDQFKVPEREKKELLGALGGMKGDIVGV
jgi:hemoglobin